MKVFTTAPGVSVPITAANGSSRAARELLQRPAAAILRKNKTEYIPPAMEILWVREMSAEEARVVAETKPKRPEMLANKLRAQHHAIARMMVAGAKDAEIARAIGISPATISYLRDSPAFVALYAEYAAMADEAAVDMRARLAAAAGLAVDEVTRRLAETPESLPTKELREITTSLLDRIGHGPTSKVESVTAVLSLEDIRAMKSARKSQVIIDHDISTPVSVNGAENESGVDAT